MCHIRRVCVLQLVARHLSSLTGGTPSGISLPLLVASSYYNLIGNSLSSIIKSSGLSRVPICSSSVACIACMQSTPFQYTHSYSSFIFPGVLDVKHLSLKCLFTWCLLTIHSICNLFSFLSVGSSSCKSVLGFEIHQFFTSIMCSCWAGNSVILMFRI